MDGTSETFPSPMPTGFNVRFNHDHPTRLEREPKIIAGHRPSKVKPAHLENADLSKGVVILFRLCNGLGHQAHFVSLAIHL